MDEAEIHHLLKEIHHIIILLLMELLRLMMGILMMITKKDNICVSDGIRGAVFSQPAAQFGINRRIHHITYHYSSTYAVIILMVIT
jgi:hypothetical protein